MQLKTITFTALILLNITVGYANEKVYLHFDNTGYFLGETMWFSAYVKDTETNLPTDKSRVLYVELLAPEGDVLDTRIYKLEHGMCAGDISLHLGYLSGFFEVRAYTRYMLNWGYDNYFSRVFPVYDAVKDGDYSFRSMLRRERVTDTESENEWRNVNGFASSGKKNSGIMSLPVMRQVKPDCTPAVAITPEWLSVTGNSDALKPYQKIRLTFHGKPNERFSLSVSDDESRPKTGNGSTIAEWVQDNTATDAGSLQSLNMQNADALFVMPEKDLTIRGRVVTKKSYYRARSKMVAVAKAGLTFNMTTPAAKYNSLFTADDKGYFTISLGDFSGSAMAFLHYTGGWDKNVSIRIDRWFSPPPRKYGEHELSRMETSVSDVKAVAADSLTGHMLQNVTVDGKKRRHTYREYVHSIQKLFLPEEVEWMADNEDFEPESPAYGYYRMLYLIGGIFDHHHYTADAIRMVMLPGEYPGDSVVPGYKWIYDGGLRPFFRSKYVIIRTDWPVREAYNYSSLPVERQSKNTISIGSDNFKETGLRGDLPSGKYPYYVMFFDPFSESEEDVRLNRFNLTENTRYTTVHGFTHADTFAIADYGQGTPLLDYRRTLYWNPDVTTDSNGNATVEFYNNSSCRQMIISAEGITKEGMPVMYKNQ